MEQEVYPKVTPSTSNTLRLQSPTNPQASLLGLPAELRLEIYSHLYDTLIVHVCHRSGRNASRFTWSPCRSVSASSPLLCANPKWSGMCKQEDRCTYDASAQQEQYGAWALAASNRLIREEAHELFFRESVVSVHPQDLTPWLDHLAERDPCHIEKLRHVTLAGPNYHRILCRIEFETLRTLIPNLHSLGVQCQNPLWHWVNMSQSDVKPMEVDRTKWHTWNIVQWVREFDPTITIALEAMIWRKPHTQSEPEQAEEQVVIQLLREGKVSSAVPGSGWSDTDINLSIFASDDLAPCKKGTNWKQWWQGKGMESWTTLSPFWS
jgi:hypothetical protein